MTTSAETAGNGSEETEAANKTDRVVSVVEAFGFGEKVLDELEAVKNASKDDTRDIGEVSDTEGWFNDHVRKSPFVVVGDRELAIRDHIKNSNPATAIIEVLSRDSDGQETVIGRVGSTKVMSSNSETGEHTVLPDTAGIPVELGSMIQSVAQATHERIEAQQQLPVAA